ncbi:MAG: DNA primase [Buchnera aphidicola (Kaburagia rhusicola rhusicola)]
MKGIIPKNFINELLNHTNIVDVIKTRIPLKKSGKNYNAHCPFHQENTPSFTVSYEKQFYYCFGCNSHGNIIDFLINYEQLTFIESIEELATINGFKVPYQKRYLCQKFDYEKRNNLYLLTEKLSRMYHENIFNVKHAYKYLLDRGINKLMIQYFKIGFSCIDWNDMDKKIQTSNFKELIDVGVLIINDKGRKYDRLRGRIIFPIHNKIGKIVGFGGRSLNNSTPKYINSPETHIFKKSRNWYGLFESLKYNPKPEKLLVVEGYFDVITLFQFNINYSIASLGTSITNYQIQLLFRITNTIIYCYDGDIAGKKAAWRTLNITLPYIFDGKHIKFIFLPHGEDPDTIIRKEGKKMFEHRINNAENLSNFLFNQLLENINLNSINERSYWGSNIINLINKIPGKIMKMYLLKELGNRIGAPDQAILKQLIVTHTHDTFKKNKEKKKIAQTTIRILIGLLIQNPKLALVIPSTKYFNDCHITGLPVFLNLVKTCIEFPNCNTGQILETYRHTKIFEKLNELAKWNHMISTNKIQQVFLDSLSNIHNKILEDKKNKLIAKERKTGLKKCEKNELWSINKKLAKI